MPLGRLAVFRLPHRALLCESSANKESQLIHPTQLLLGSALRFMKSGRDFIWERSIHEISSIRYADTELASV
jgi:hypothetical protein